MSKTAFPLSLLFEEFDARLKSRRKPAFTG
jgi:hypothetical protein